MGNCFSIDLGQAVSQVCSCVRTEAAYIHNLEKNLKALQIAVAMLRENRDDLLRRLDREEGRGLQGLNTVKGWLSGVEKIDTQVEQLLKDGTIETQRLCLCGYASNNCVSSYRYGKMVFDTIKELEHLISEGDFDVVADQAPVSEVDIRPIQPTVGTETMLEEAWRRFMKDGVGILGLYGMAGVGKTTLLTQINNKFSESTNKFDIVFWVVVSKNLRVESIQEEIGKKLRIFSEDWKQKRQDEKAIEIWKVLSKKKFALLLDDIWMKVDLAKVGVPYPDEVNGCKIVFTTRSREVCGSMGANDEMEVRCLDTNTAWDLFQKKIRQSTFNSHPDIPKRAEIIVHKCRGLPLALNIIGEAMASKRTHEEWNRAIDVLSSSAAKFPGMEDEILPILKFSYDELKEHVKPCFLYCALFPEDENISQEGLIDYWVCEGFIDGEKDRNVVENEGFDIIATLLHACLLEDPGNGTVRMHDVVREMALWIASDFGEQKEKLVVQSGFGLQQIPKVENWEDVNQMSLMRNQIEDIAGSPDCPKLTTLLLNKNKLVNISSNFFWKTPSLVVLDLSYNYDLVELPEEVLKLQSLRYLNLSDTGIRELSFGLEDLRNLIYLNLENTTELEGIVGILNLSNLQVVNLFLCGVRSSLRLVEELSHLKYLKYLSITIEDATVLERFLSVQKLVCCTETLDLGGIESTSKGISFMADVYNLRWLTIEECDFSEIKIDWKSEIKKMISSQHITKGLYNSCFHNLGYVSISNCNSVRDLTWLLFAPNISFLEVSELWEVKEIISKEKSIGVTKEQPETMLFEKLRVLTLQNLPKLESIYWEPLSFPSLVKFSIEDCPKLKKLPLNSKSGKGNELVLRMKEEEMEELQWEDEDTKKRFLNTTPYRMDTC